MHNKQRWIAVESLVLFGICLADLTTTLFWVTYHNASEGNPLMAFYLTHGGKYGFIGAKLILCVMPLVIAEWARRTRPQFVHRALRVGIAGYLGLYGMGVRQCNVQDRDMARLHAMVIECAQPPDLSQRTPFTSSSGEKIVFGKTLRR